MSEQNGWARRVEIDLPTPVANWLERVGDGDIAGGIIEVSKRAGFPGAPKDDPLLTVAEASELAGDLGYSLAPSTLRYNLKVGNIAGEKDAHGYWLIRRSEIERVCSGADQPINKVDAHINGKARTWANWFVLSGDWTADHYQDVAEAAAREVYAWSTDDADTIVLNVVTGSNTNIQVDSKFYRDLVRSIGGLIKEESG